MAPEQARGLAVDRRADIWSFGVLLFEMLAGPASVRRRHAHRRARRRRLDASPIGRGCRPATPPRLERLIRRCLEKDPRQRLRDIGDARIELEQLISGRDRRRAARSAGAPAAIPPSRRSLMSLGGAVAAGLAVFLLLRPTPDVEPGTQRFNVALPPGLRIDDALDAGRQPLALSRDGRQLAFVTRDRRREEADLRAADGPRRRRARRRHRRRRHAVLLARRHRSSASRPRAS